MVQTENFNHMAQSSASLPIPSKLSFSISRILDFDSPTLENQKNLKRTERYSHAPSAFAVVTATTSPLKESQTEVKDRTSETPTPGNEGEDQEWITGSQAQFGILSPGDRRVGHPYQSRAPPKHKKPRTSFTKSQVTELERRFNDQKYLASTERASLAKHLQMSDAQIKTWFQNRRTKWRRQAAEEKEQERQAACKYLQSSPYLASAYSNPPSYLARPDVAI